MRMPAIRSGTAEIHQGMPRLQTKMPEARAALTSDRMLRNDELPSIDAPRW